MTFSHMLSRRHAIMRSLTLVVALSLLTTCTDNQATDSLGPPADPGSVMAVKVAPDSMTLEINQAGHFKGYGITPKSDSSRVWVEWVTSGGTITKLGAFSSAKAGKYEVIGRIRGRRTMSDTAVVVVVPPQPALARIVVTPDTATILPGASLTFSAVGKLIDSSTAQIGVAWSASAGTIDQGGVYTAGMVAGSYQVIATIPTGTLADTSQVTIPQAPAPTPPPAPSVTQVVLTPSSVALTPAAAQQFQVYARTATGDSIAATTVYEATGGSVTPAGLYTAGSTTGTFRVIATQSGGTLADTSTVTITSVAPPPPVPCVSSGTLLCPGDDLQAKATAAGSGAMLTLQPGVYRMQTITPKTGQSFIGQAGAILSGAKLLRGWVRSGATWYVTGQTQEFAHTVGVCDDGGTACRYPEDVYRDNVLLHRELSLAAVGAGDFFFDYAADRIYVGDDPAGHTLEAAATEYAFEGTVQGAGGVTIRGLIIEKYANPAQYGAIGHSAMPANSVIRENEIRYNHGGGIRGGVGVVVAKNRIHHNGQIGVIGNYARVDSNEISYNNTAGFKADWEAGGTKFAQAVVNLVVRGNFVHHNTGPGLWTDHNNINITYTENTVEDNTDVGILHEISYHFTITNNVVKRNGFDDPSPKEGAGIMIYSAGGTVTSEISGNIVEGNKNGIVLIQAERGSGLEGEFVTKNVLVHDNTITMGPGQRSGADRYGGNTGLFTTNNIHFERNTWNLQSADPSPFMWEGANRTDGQWIAYGNDDTGTLNR